MRSESLTKARPLGVLPDVDLTAEQTMTLAALESFDLSPVRLRLLQEGALPERMVDDALLELRRYLGLRAFHPGPIIMFSGHIDRAWHTCIIFTRLYADLCQRAFGYFVHHEPTMHEDHGRAEKIAAARALYERIYGPMGRLWGSGHRSRCG